MKAPVAINTDDQLNRGIRRWPQGGVYHYLDVSALRGRADRPGCPRSRGIGCKAAESRTSLAQVHEETPLQRLAIPLIIEALAFVESSQRLDDVTRRLARFAGPRYHLLCHGIELTLKSYLAASGGR